jgi:hypothetical protein
MGSNPGAFYSEIIIYLGGSRELVAANVVNDITVCFLEVVPEILNTILVTGCVKYGSSCQSTGGTR